MRIDFGLHFFPDFTPAEKSAEACYRDFLAQVDLVDELGYKFVRIVEHYFEPYGGYSPNPLVFLAAASQRTKTARLIPGALLPVFNNPLKMAGEIAMVDAISGGRAEAAFARAFLPHEFARFRVSMDESRARFNEGVEAVRRLLENEVASFSGKFVSFENITSLPRPTQRPRPPIWIAVLATPESFEEAGRNGYYIMANPIAAEQLARMITLYRDAWRAAGHAGKGRIMISFRTLVMPDGDRARAVAKAPTLAHNHALVTAAKVVEGWGTGKAAKDYPNYEKIIARLESETYEEMIAKGSTWVGSPAEVRVQIRRYYEQVGGFDEASINGIPHLQERSVSEASLRLFAKEVMPEFA